MASKLNAIFIFCFILSLSLGNPNEKYHQECGISVEDLRKLIGFYRDVSKDDDFSLPHDATCDQLLVGVINHSSIVRNRCEEKTEIFEKNFNETQEELLQSVQSLANDAKLQEISDDFKQIYGEIYKETSSKIKAIRQQTEAELKNQAELGETFDYYSLFLSLDRSSGRYEKSCSVNNENGKTLLSIADQILVFLTGEKFDGDCERLSKKMMNVKSIITWSEKRNEGRLELMKKSLQARKQFVSSMIHDNAQELRDFEGLRHNVTYLQTALDETVKLNEAMRKDIEEMSLKYVVKMIQQEDSLFEARSIIRKTSNPEAYGNSLREACSCDEENFYKVVNFAELCGGEGFKIILDKIQSCSKLDHPVLLKLQKVLKKEELKNHVEKIYLTFSQQLRMSKTDTVLSVVKKFSGDIVDLPKLVRLTYNKNVNNFLAVTSFIDAIDATDSKSNKNLEKILYDEMMDLNQVDTVEHVMFGFWLNKKLHQISEQTSPTKESLNQRDRITELKYRLPEGIQNLFFEPYFIIANPDFTHLIRGYDYDSVKLIAKPADEGKYFVIEDIKHGTSLYRTKIDGKQGVMVGKGNHKGFYWQILPTSNATMFIFKNYVDDSAISSKEHKRCIEVKKSWFDDDKCLRYEYYNLAFGPSETRHSAPVYEESQRWKITTALIRNGILQDRTRRLPVKHQH